VSTKPKIPKGSLDHCCRIGTAKATVFPEPVLLPPIQSRPERISGMAALWMRVGFLMAMFAREETNQGETFRSANVDFSLPFCAAVMVSVVVVVVAVLVVVEGTDLALIRDMDGWMRDVVVMGTAFCCTVSTSDSESDDSVGVSLRRFLDPFEFTSLRSLWLLLADESLELPESEPEMEAAILEYSPIEPLY
jgi:hypothetical protein